MNVGYAALVTGIIGAWRKWRMARRMKRDLRGIATARMREWEVDRLNADLKEHHQGRNPTTRITIKPKPEKADQEAAGSETP